MFEECHLQLFSVIFLWSDVVTSPVQYVIDFFNIVFLAIFTLKYLIIENCYITIGCRGVRGTSHW